MTHHIKSQATKSGIKNIGKNKRSAAPAPKPYCPTQSPRLPSPIPCLARARTDLRLVFGLDDASAAVHHPVHGDAVVAVGVDELEVVGPAGGGSRELGTHLGAIAANRVRGCVAADTLTVPPTLRRLRDG